LSKTPFRITRKKQEKGEKSRKTKKFKLQKQQYKEIQPNIYIIFLNYRK
jgi:hypothetical protein